MHRTLLLPEKNGEGRFPARYSVHNASAADTATESAGTAPITVTLNAGAGYATSGTVLAGSDFTAKRMAGLA